MIGALERAVAFVEEYDWSIFQYWTLARSWRSARQTGVRMRDACPCDLSVSCFVEYGNMSCFISLRPFASMFVTWSNVDTFSTAFAFKLAN